MNFLEQKILSDGNIKEGNILKIDNFLNHQIDIGIMRQIAHELKRRFRDVTINKVRTIFAENCVAVVFLLAVVLNLVLPNKPENQAPEVTNKK